MKHGNEPKQPEPKKPQQQEGEEFGGIMQRQLDEDHFPGRSDTPRGSEPEQRGTSGRRS